MRTTDSSGRPLRYVPRQPDPLREPQRTTDRAGPPTAGPLSRDLLPLSTLPGAAVDEQSLFALVNAIRAVLLSAGLAGEEKA